MSVSGCFSSARKTPIGMVPIAKKAFANFIAHDMPTYAAALAYRLLFSIFPFLVFLTTLLGFLGMPELFDWMRSQAAYVLPNEAMDLVNTVVTELETPRGGLMSVAIALAVWSASAAVLGTSVEQVGAEIAKGRNKAVSVPERIPVYVSYFTAWPNKDGKVEFFDDVYGRDAYMRKAMEATRQVRQAQS